MGVSSLSARNRMDIRDVYEKLKRKRELAIKAYEIVEKKLMLNIEPVMQEAYRMFGKLQRADLGIEPGQKAYEAIVDSFPGLLAQEALYRKKVRGELVNNVLVLQGPGGVGKSSYAYWLARLLGGRFVNPAADVKAAIREIVERGEWYPVLVLDDLSTVISKYWFMDKSARDEWKGFFNAIEYAKDFSGVLLVTSRSFEGVAKRIREIASFQGVYKRVYIQGYVIDIIEWREPGRRMPSYLDILWPGVKMPSEAWAEMMKARRMKALELLGGGAR